MGKKQIKVMDTSFRYTQSFLKVQEMLRILFPL